MSSFPQHNLYLVVSGHWLLISVMNFHDKFASLRQVNSPNGWDKFQIMLYRHIFDKISSEFCGILHVVVNFADLPEYCGSTTMRNIRSPGNNLRKQQFILTPHRWGCFVRRNVRNSATKIPYWWCRICPESSHESWLDNRVVALF